VFERVVNPAFIGETRMTAYFVWRHVNPAKVIGGVGVAEPGELDLEVRPGLVARPCRWQTFVTLDGWRGGPPDEWHVDRRKILPKNRQKLLSQHDMKIGS
jgi:hypothetical protein